MNIIILGHTGFIGSNIYQYLSSTGEYNVIGISTNEIDLTKVNSHQILQQVLTSDCIVIICAGIKKQLEDNLESFEKNIAIVNNSIRAISKVNPEKIIYFSSCSVYGEDVNYHGKISEESPVHLRTYYGISKYTAECLLEKNSTDLQIPLTILRPPLIYGRDDLSRGYGPTGFTYKAENNEEIILWGAGNEFREFIYVDDIGRTVKRLINNDYCGILNLVSGQSHTYKEIVYLLHEIIGSNIKVISHQRTKEKVNHHFSSKLIHNVLGDFEFTSLKNGLRKMHRSIIN